MFFMIFICKFDNSKRTIVNYYILVHHIVIEDRLMIGDRYLTRHWK